ncbi:MAG TPA: hypothetical protein VK473_05665 [Terriglobales bacterium]|nr:hypothetical protein [Terriglobales bacterium]
MRRAVLFVALTLLLIAGSSFVLAQEISEVYWVNYFSNRLNSGAPAVSSLARLDQTVRIINPGEQGTPISARGTVCAAIYVFDDNQEMSECCSCPITPTDC